VEATAFARRAVWMFDRRLQAEHDADAIVETCRRFNVDAVQQEVLYGLVYQGQIDGGLAPTSLEAVRAEAARFADAGIDYVPVVVPRGLPGEAQAHGAVAAACGSLVVDLEYEGVGPGKEYWNAAPELIEVYARELRAAAPKAAIGWQPDGRIADPKREAEWELLVAAVQPYVDCWLPQLYCGWGVYGRGEATVAADLRRFERFLATGRPVAPTLYLSESLAEPLALWQRIDGRAAGVVAFRFGAMDGAALAALQGMALPEPAAEAVASAPSARAGEPQAVPEIRGERIRRLQDALTVQAAALRDMAARATIQAENLEQLVRGSGEAA
jgi:hypothetical protein